MTTETSDRELLELAAKAAELEDFEYAQTVAGTWAIFYRSEDGQVYWNPLEDDGDEARLEAVLSMNVSWGPNRVQVGRDIQFAPAEYYVDHSGDKRAARRLAGVRAAAEIGKSMITEDRKMAGIPSSMDADMVRTKIRDKLEAMRISTKNYAILSGYDHDKLERFLEGADEKPCAAILKGEGLMAVTYYEYAQNGESDDCDVFTAIASSAEEMALLRAENARLAKDQK